MSLTTNSLAQDLVVRTYGINSPLKTNVIYDIYFSKEGLLYITTDNGFWTYNGLTFSKHEGAGLNTTEVTNMHEDQQGNIYFQNFIGEVFCWNGDSLRLHMNPSKLGFQFNGFYRIGDYEYYIGTKQILIKVAHDSSWTKTIKITEGEFMTGITVNGYFVRGIKNNLNEVLQLAQDTVIVVDTFRCLSYQTELYDYHNSYAIPANLENGQKYVVTAERDTLAEVTFFGAERSLNLFGRTFLRGRQGLYDVVNETLYLSGRYVSQAKEDQEGNLWVSTLTHGLLKISNLKAKLYPFAPNEKADFVLRQDSALIVTNSVGGLYNWDAKMKSFQQFYQSRFRAPTKSLVYHPIAKQFIYSSNETLLLGANFQTRSLNDGTYTFQLVNDNKGFFSFHKGRIAYGAWEHFGARNSNTKYEAKNYEFYTCTSSSLPTYHLSINHCHSITQYQSWVVALRKDTLTYIHTEQLDSVRNYQLPNAQKVQLLNERLWILTTDALIEYNAFGEILNRIPRTQGLEQHITYLFINDQYFVISTREGIYLLDAYSLERIHLFTVENGIASSDFDKAWIYQGALYINGSKGVSVLPLDGNYNKGKPQLKIVQVLSDSQALGNQAVLNYHQNDLSIQLQVQSYTVKGDLFWRLNDKAWRVLEGTTWINLEALEAGSYQVEAYFENELGTQSPRIQYTFEIQPPYWKTWWFNILILILVLGGIAFWSWRRVQQQTKEVAMQLQVSDLKMKALQAQMNPHFIFNIQTAIQGLWLEGKETAALDLQTNFSKLLRKIFQYSSQKNISIEQLVTFLEGYIELEQIRFEHEIVVDIEVDEMLYEQDCFVPPLLVQPVLENSFKHGLLHRKGERKLELSLQYAPPYLYAVVEDNGIGRQQTINPLEQKKVSGLQVTQERLTILQQAKLQQTHPENNLKITDLKDDLGQALGTKVELWIALVDYEREA